MYHNANYPTSMNIGQKIFFRKKFPALSVTDFAFINDVIQTSCNARNTSLHKGEC